jgi:hypothetical protein
MDNLSNLSKLGKVGGVPGIALGSAVLVLGSVLSVTDALPEAWRGPLLMLVVLGAVGFVAVALAGWMRLNRVGDQVARTDGDNSAARNEDAGKGGGRQDATTRGKDSPATNIRR